MDTISKMIEYISTNSRVIFDLIAYVIAIASIVVKITPTLKDDNYLKPLIKFVGKFLALDKYGPTTKPGE